MRERMMRDSAISTANVVDDKVGNLAAVARDVFDTGLKRARRGAENAGEWTSDKAATMSDVSLRGYRTATEAVRNQPVMAIGIAALVGLAIGAMLFSRQTRY
jgi:ElaB/YqjD/DUF883 family membrane-anchored ribosome-binding protein